MRPASELRPSVSSVQTADTPSGFTEDILTRLAHWLAEVSAEALGNQTAPPQQLRAAQPRGAEPPQ
jgi:hypothetical protein